MAYPKLRSRLRLEVLEQRDCPAPLVASNDSSNNRTITGTISPLGLTVTATGPNKISVVDGVTPILTNVTVNNLTIIASSTDESVTLNLNGNTLDGNFSFDGGSSADSFTLDDTVGTGSLGGSLTLTRVAGTISLSPTVPPTTIGGNLVVNTAGENSATNLTANGLFVGGYVNFKTGNGNDNFSFADGAIGGALSLTMGNGLATVDLSSSSVNSTVTVTTGSGNDLITVDDSALNGGATFNLGAAVTSNNLTITGSTIERSLSIYGGVSDDNVTLGGAGADGNIFGGSVYMNLYAGTNDANVFNNIFGTNLTLSYYGGTGEDTLTYNPNADSALISLYATLGAGDDILRLTNDTGPVPLKYANVDFGAGADKIEGVDPASNTAPVGNPNLDFPQYFRNLP